MMKVKVISPFIDKVALLRREVGEVLDLELNRAKYLESIGLVERVGKKKTK